VARRLARFSCGKEKTAEIFSANSGDGGYGIFCAE
jgi:hypothetical protein